MASRSISVLIEKQWSKTPVDPTLQAWPEELSSIYTAHYGEILQVCRQFFRQKEDAEDAAAEVFLKLHKILDKKDPALPFRPWLSQVARRHCIDKLRRRKVELRLFPEGSDIRYAADVWAPSPLAQVLRKEKQRQVMEQLNRLPDHYKVPLMLRYHKQMSYSEIAGALNRGLPAVRLMIFRAKNKLRSNLRLLGWPQVVASLQQMD